MAPLLFNSFTQNSKALKKLSLLLVLIILNISVKSQTIKEWGIGGELAYNIPIKGFGFGVRSHLHFSKRIVVAPQYAYYPGWNKVSESYFGVDLHYNFTPDLKWGLYGTAGPYYNHWSNFEESLFSKAQLVNFSTEFGGGVIKNNGCVRPFMEFRANSKWWESNLRLGVLVYFGGCGKVNDFSCPAFTQL